MDSFLQIQTLIFSFGYGMFFYYLAKYNLYLIKNLRIITQYLITIVFIVDSVLLYVYLLFKINHGFFHIYFFFMFMLGFCLSIVINKKIVNFCKVLKNKEK